MNAMIEIQNAEKTFVMHLQGGVELPVVRGVSFHVDGTLVKTVSQSPSYPMQLMLSIYEFPPDDGGRRGDYPKEFVVESVRGLRLTS